MNKTLYAILWQLATIWLPAAGTLVFALQPIWGYPYAEQIVGTIVAVDAFLGTVLHISPTPTAAADGTLTVHDTPNKMTYEINVATPLEKVPDKDTLTFKVRPPANGTGIFKLVQEEPGAAE